MSEVALGIWDSLTGNNGWSTEGKCVILIIIIALLILERLVQRYNRR